MAYYITDRSAAHVSRLKLLREKGWLNMTAEERDEWNGVVGQNLFDAESLIPESSIGENISFENDTIIIDYIKSSILEPVNNAEIVIDDISKYVDKNNRLTVGVDRIVVPDGARALIQFGYLRLGGFIFEEYSPTIYENGYATYTVNTGARNALRIYYHDLRLNDKIYVHGLRINRGNRIYPYVPFGESGANDVVRGAYNFTDFNRVEQSVAYLSDAFGLSLVTKTDWTADAIPNVNDFENRYLYNVNKVCEKAGINGVTTTYAGFDYRAANEIEKALKSAEETLW